MHREVGNLRLSPIGSPRFTRWHHYFLIAEAWAGSGAADPAPWCSEDIELTPGQRVGGKPLRVAVLHSQDQVDRVLGHCTSGPRVGPAPAGHRVWDRADGTYDRIRMMRLVPNEAVVALLGTMIGHGQPQSPSFCGALGHEPRAPSQHAGHPSAGYRTRVGPAVGLICIRVTLPL